MTTLRSMTSVAASSTSSTSNSVLSKLSEYHPVVIEGMGYYDPRDAATVASNIVRSVQTQLQATSNTTKPLLVIAQGDPLHEKGISAITPLVAKVLSRGERGLVCLDASIDPSHTRNADRTGVILEVSYSQLQQYLSTTVMDELTLGIHKQIVQQNQGRAAVGKPPVKEYFQQYALLQEVTKAGLRQLCNGSITIAHTSRDINPFSVTSFYKVGLSLHLYHPHDIVSYTGPTDSLDFNTIDPR